MEDKGTLVSEKITWGGFITAMIDVGIMGVFLFAMMGALHTSTLYSGSEEFISIVLLALTLLLLERFLKYYFMVTHPKENYEMKRVFAKDGVETTELFSYR